MSSVLASQISDLRFVRVGMSVSIVAVLGFSGMPWFKYTRNSITGESCWLGCNCGLRIASTHIENGPYFFDVGTKINYNNQLTSGMELGSW
jgi:hypothetical protein